MGQPSKKKTSGRIKAKRATKKNRNTKIIKQVRKRKPRRRLRRIRRILRKRKGLSTNSVLLSRDNLPQTIASLFRSPRDVEQKNIWKRIFQSTPNGYTVPDMSIIQPLLEARKSASGHT